MDELEIKIVLSYKVPENGLILNGILRGLQEDQNTLMRNIVKAILAALEEKAIEEYISSHPDTYYRYGRQPRERKFITSFGPIRYRLAQLYDRQTKKVFPPLVKRLSILSHKQYQREALEAAVGQVIHLSYRLGEKEVRRIKGYAPGKSTVHRGGAGRKLRAVVFLEAPSLQVFDGGWDEGQTSGTAGSASGKGRHAVGAGL